jgi:hypothetical protein
VCLSLSVPLPAPVSDRGIAGGLSKSGLIGELDGKSILTPYLVTTRFERRRALAATLSDTLYVGVCRHSWQCAVCMVPHARARPLPCALCGMLTWL